MLDISVPSTNSQLLTAIGTFALSFFILISIWIRYTTLMSALPVQTAILFDLNVFLLFLVALEPYLFNILAAQVNSPSSLGPVASSYYALDVGGMGLVLAYFTHVLVNEEKGLVQSSMIRPIKSGRNMILVIGLIFVLTALPLFWTITLGKIPLRFIVWIAMTPLIRLTDIRLRNSDTSGEAKA